jgi:hypothetical protein
MLISVVNEPWGMYKHRNFKIEIWEIYLFTYTFVLQYCLHNLALQMISYFFCMIQYELLRVIMIMHKRISNNCDNCVMLYFSFNFIFSKILLS